MIMIAERSWEPEERELSDVQRQCIELLIAGKTKTAAAEAVGVARNTVSRWFQDPFFVAALNARRLDVQEANVERLRSLTERALAVLENALDDPNPKVRMQAAMQILQAVKLTELPSPSRLTTPEDVEEKWLADAEFREALAEIRRLTQLMTLPEPRAQLTTIAGKSVNR
jgi:hypothetical protein